MRFVGQQGESYEASVSKIVIGALTAAVWFAFCYVARAEGICGSPGDCGACFEKYVGHPAAGAVIREPGIKTTV
jgi:hypothetical protein